MWCDVMWCDVIAAMCNSAFFQHYPLSERYVGNALPTQYNLINLGYLTQDGQVLCVNDFIHSMTLLRVESFLLVTIIDVDYKMSCLVFEFLFLLNYCLVVWCRSCQRHMHSGMCLFVTNQIWVDWPCFALVDDSALSILTFSFSLPFSPSHITSHSHTCTQVCRRLWLSSMGISNAERKLGRPW